MAADENRESRSNDLTVAECDEIVAGLRHFAILIAGAHAEHGPFHRFVGSATLVTFGNTHCLLTAAHVWTEITKQGYKYVGLPIREQDYRPFAIATSYIEAHKTQPNPPGNLGPDLALLRIPSVSAASIQNANGSFYNLDLLRTEEPEWAEEETWVLMGAPAEHTAIENGHASLAGEAYFCSIDRPPARDGFDYVEADMDIETPTSFGGVSGGGLWRIVLARSAGILRWDKSLQGVAFYEEALTPETRIVRCHGKRSIVEQLLPLADSSSRKERR